MRRACSSCRARSGCGCSRRAIYAEQPEAFVELERQSAENPHPQTVDAFCDQAEAVLGHTALEEVADIGAPTLITVGDRDILTPPAHARALHERVPKSAAPRLA